MLVYWGCFLLCLFLQPSFFFAPPRGCKKRVHAAEKWRSFFCIRAAVQKKRCWEKNFLNKLLFKDKQNALSSVGRTQVSKTWCRGFKSYRAWKKFHNFWIFHLIFYVEKFRKIDELNFPKTILLSLLFICFCTNSQQIWKSINIKNLRGSWSFFL